MSEPPDFVQLSFQLGSLESNLLVEVTEGSIVSRDFYARNFATVSTRRRHPPKKIGREFRALQIEHQERAFFATSKGLVYWLSNERIREVALDQKK